MWLAVSGTLSGCTSHPGGKGQKLVGTIYVTGNEPFTQLAIETGKDSLSTISPHSPVYKELWQLQGRKVVLHFTLNRKNADGVYVTAFEIIKK